MVAEGRGRDVELISLLVGLVQTKRGRPPRLIHEHHIKVLKPDEIDQLREPLCPEPDVSIYPYFFHSSLHLSLLVNAR